MNISFDKFQELLYKAWSDAGGDLYKFWEILNPEQGKIKRTSIQKRVWLYVNDCKTYKTRKIKINDSIYIAEFRTVTVPQYSGSIILEDYTIDDVAEKKKIIVFKYTFDTKTSAASQKKDEKDELGF